MTAINPFVLEKEDYKRDISFLKHTVQDVTKFLSVMTGDSPEKCSQFIKDSLRPGGRFEFKDPKIVYLERNEWGDRHEKEGTLLGYLTDSIKNEELIAPTLTTYLNPKVKKSMLVDFVDENVAIRSRAKKQMFAAAMRGDKDTEVFKNSEQSNAKISNNAISGGHVSTSTPLNNKTAHSTLTSNCRSTSGYGNANNEKMLSGNRHYHTPHIVINNIISIANRTDLVKLQSVMTKYNMHYPTPKEALECVAFSSQLYWKSKKAMTVIAELLEKITPIERAAFVYIGDLFHIALHNDSLVRNFIDRLSTPRYKHYEHPKKVVKENREEFISLAAQLHPKMMKDLTEKEIAKKQKGVQVSTLVEEDPIDHNRLCHIAATMENIRDTLEDHRDFIDCFFVSDNVPASLAFFPQSIRRSALTSDTDSTIFTVQDWVKWKTGRLVVDDETNGVAATMIFLAAEAITHILARMSANFGIETARIHQVAMKNEFKFDVFVPTQVGKHYFAYIGCQEGNLYIEYDMEIKGVHLKSSNVPAHVMKEAENLMREIMDLAAQGKSISIKKILDKIATVEKDIVASALRGEPTYFRSQQIKSANSYSLEPHRSPYQHYTMWQECFASKYGDLPPPPYSVSKVAVNLSNQNAILAWINSIEDEQVRKNLTLWNAKAKKAGMGAFLLPQSILAEKGIPEEIVKVMDTRRLVLDITMVFYLILETLGYYCIDDKISELVSDYYG